jgi:hypothetical protein
MYRIGQEKTKYVVYNQFALLCKVSFRKKKMVTFFIPSLRY